MKKINLVLFIMILTLGLSSMAISKEAPPGADNGFPPMAEMPSISDVPLNTDTYALETNEEITDADQLKARAEEIRDMDTSELSSEQRQDLRSELRDTKEALQARGVYIGFGTLLLIVVLIILLA